MNIMLNTHVCFQFAKDGKYDLDFKNPASNPTDYLTSDQLASLYHEFISHFPG